MNDKTIRDSQKSGKTLQELTEFYTKEFLDDLERLNIVKADTIAPISTYLKIWERWSSDSWISDMLILQMMEVSIIVWVNSKNMGNSQISIWVGWFQVCESIMMNTIRIRLQTLRSGKPMIRSDGDNKWEISLIIDHSPVIITWRQVGISNVALVITDFSVVNDIHMVYRYSFLSSSEWCSKVKHSQEKYFRNTGCMEDIFSWTTKKWQRVLIISIRFETS